MEPAISVKGLINQFGDNRIHDELDLEVQRGEIFSIVKTINGLGTPILMVEQNAKQALTIADHGYVLVDGQNKFYGSGQDLLDDPEVAEMFLGGGKALPEVAG